MYYGCVSTCSITVSHEKDALEFRWQTDAGVLRKSPNLTFLNAYLAQNETSYCESSHWRGKNYNLVILLLIVMLIMFIIHITSKRASFFSADDIILMLYIFLFAFSFPTGNYSCLKVELVFNRDRAYYFTTVFIPDIILVTSSFITFWLEWNAVPARVMLGVTTMLNFFTTRFVQYSFIFFWVAHCPKVHSFSWICSCYKIFSNTFRSTLPVVSNLTAMNIWDGFSMFFIYASLLEFVFVNYIGRKRPRRPYEPGDPRSSAQVCNMHFNVFPYFKSLFAILLKVIFVFRVVIL